MSTVKPRIGPADHGRPMTLDEFREAEEVPGYLYELARGVLEVGEVPRDEHRQIIDNLQKGRGASTGRNASLAGTRLSLASSYGGF
jgi:hypothetical protein